MCHQLGKPPYRSRHSPQDLAMPTEYTAHHCSSSWSERSLDHETHPHHDHVVIKQYSVLLNPSGCDLRREVGQTISTAESLRP